MTAGRASASASSQSLKAVLGIRDLVYSGAVRPGDRLSEITISERLDLSRTPVRAALARLEQEGILELIPSGGYAVRSFTQGDVEDAIELRGVIEGTAARLAAERGITPARAAQLSALLDNLDHVVGLDPSKLDFQAYVEMNAQFHEALKTLSGSEIIAREIDRINTLPFAGPSAFLHVQDEFPQFRASLAVGQAQHRAIFEAIVGRESARAEALAREHARLARKNLEFVMQNRNLRQLVPGLVLLAG